MIASQEINAHLQDVIKVCHGLALLAFGVAIVFAGMTVSKLRSPSDSYNARLFTFGYFSLGAWILWVLQYAILSAPFLSFPSGSSLATVVWLGFVQDALWICAALSLHLRFFSRKSRTLPLLALFSAVFAWVAYRTSILTSLEMAGSIALVELLLTVPFFMVLAASITQLRFSKFFAAVFLIHGYSQAGWRWLWLSPLATTRLVQLGFPTWRIFLFIVWATLVSEMAQRIEPADQKIAQVSKQPPPDIQIPKTPNLLATFKVMISSTVEDLGPEREAVDRAISELNLTRFRAETFGSSPHPPDVICAFMAEQCDIFVLIIGERYGYTIRSREMSVVQFEYEVARRQNRGKILVYIKEGVTRDPRLEPFVQRLEDFEDGHFRSLFKTPKELEKMIQKDIQRWIVLRAARQGLQSFDSPPNSH